MDHRGQVKTSSAAPPNGSDPRRALPSVTRIISALSTAGADLPEWCRLEGARRAIEAARVAMSQQLPPGDIEAAGLHIARELARARPRRVVNATGVVLHTNLGRAPLAPGAAEAARDAAAGYSDLELDLSSGRRGNRLAGLGDLLTGLSGAEAAHAVNNHAAAVLLALNTLARGREVVVSRGELVEIGGSFRVPEILERAGVRLVEVGTTNRTHPADYRRAIGPDTGLLLKVHRSNFAQQGFVAEVGLAELVAIGHEAGIPVVEDLGSGTLLDLRSQGLPEDTYVPARLQTGVDVLCFSGDKLLGGPQAGILLGAAETMAALRANPLSRALRLDKMSLAALDFTLRAQLEGRAEELPTVRMLGEPLPEVERRAQELREAVCAHAWPGLEVGLEAVDAPVGGGSVPGFTLPSWAITLRGVPAPRLAAALRAAPVPVLARVQDDTVQLDVRALLPGDAADCAAALAFAHATGSFPAKVP